MRIILHIGMPKAGSTALQVALSQARGALGRHGILYPAAPVSPDSQNFLVAGVEDRERALPRVIRNAYDGRMERLQPAFAKWLAGLAGTVRSRRPAALVLSSEWLFGLRGAQRFDRLTAILRSLGDRVEVVAYVRRPSDQYLSSVQQVLRASHAIKPPGAVRYRGPIEDFARIADAIHVVKYDRDAFPRGDIAAHFLAAYLPEAAGLALTGDEAANASISAEGMSVLADYRRVNHRRENGRFTSDTIRLIAAIRAADEAVGGARRPRLREDVRDAIDRASVDLLWLRETYGITFDGIAYDRIAATEAPAAQRARKVEDIAEICAVDGARRNELLMRVLAGFAEESRRWPLPVSLWPGARGRTAKR